jgi:hypothetical protein
MKLTKLPAAADHRGASTVTGTSMSGNRTSATRYV